MSRKSSEVVDIGIGQNSNVNDVRRQFVKGLMLSIPASVLGIGACAGGTDQTPTDSGHREADIDGDTHDAEDSDVHQDADSPRDAEFDGDADEESRTSDADDEGDIEPDGDACESTKNDALGPFYVEGAPDRTVIAEVSEPGDRVLISGRVSGLSCTEPVPSALIEVWHADASGEYHESSEDWRLRGVMHADGDGRYQFETIRPGHYSGRPQHYHYRVSAPGHETLITQLYFTGDPLLYPNDSCGEGTCDSGDTARIIDLVEESVGSETMLVGEFNIVLAVAV